MEWWANAAALCCLAPVIYGCGGEASRIPLPDALNALNREIIESDIISPDDVETPDGFKRVAENMRTIQSQFCMANPSVMLLLKDFNIELAGSFEGTTTAGVGNIGPAPAGSISFGVKAGKTQALKLPVTVTSLSNMANVYRQYLYGDIKNDSASPEEKSARKREISDLDALAKAVISTYKEDTSSKPCKERGLRSKNPFHSPAWDEIDKRFDRIKALEDQTNPSQP